MERAGDGRKLPGCLTTAFKLGALSGWSCCPSEMDVSFLPSLGEGPSGLGCLGPRSACSSGPGRSLLFPRTRGRAGHLESPKHRSPGLPAAAVPTASSLHRPASKAWAGQQLLTSSLCWLQRPARIPFSPYETG